MPVLLDRLALTLRHSALRVMGGTGLAAALVALGAVGTGKASAGGGARGALTPETVCPPNRSRASGCSSRMNVGVPGVGTKALRGALRARAGGWRQGKVYEWPAGMAGRCADSVGADYRHGKTPLRVTVTDMIRVCTCVPGTGKVMTTHPGYLAPGTRVQPLTVHGRPLRVQRHTAGDTLYFWVADRCHVMVQVPHGLPARRLRDAVGIFDLKALEAVCRRR